MVANDQGVNGTSSVKPNEKVEMQPVKMDNPETKSTSSSQKQCKTRKLILVSILILGLSLYVTDVGLHVTIASKYLSMRNCSRNVKHTIKDFSLDKVVDINKVVGDFSKVVDSANQQLENQTESANANENENEDEKEITSNNTKVAVDDSKDKSASMETGLQKLISSKLDEIINQNVYVKLREKVFKILPEHWKQRIVDIVTFQVSRHSISSIPDICVINEQTNLTRLSQMALYICSNTLEDGSLVSREGRAIQGALFELVPSRSKENALIQHAMNGDFMFVVQDILDSNFNETTTKRINQVIEMFQNTFNEPGELKMIMGLLSNPKISANIGNLTTALGQIDPENLNGAAGALAKIDVDNMAKMEELLGKLNITLATLIVDPTIFLSFLGDPEKGKVLVELQQYLPQFEPKEINDFLTIKLEIDEHVGPDAGEILGSVMSLPFGLLQKVRLRLKF